jgi:lysophospholipase L1-like esterase
MLLVALLAALGGCAVAHGTPRSAAAAPRSSTSAGSTPLSSTGASAAPGSGPARTSPPAPVAGGESRSWQVVALGDSVTAGSNCGCTPFPELYASGLRERFHLRVSLDNRGRPGETSADLLGDLNLSAAPQVAMADVVVVTIGANDFVDVADQVLGDDCADAGDDLSCARAELAALRSRLDQVIARVRELRQGKPTAILLTGYWNVYEDGDVAEGDYSQRGQLASQRLTAAVNALVAAACSAGSTTYVDLSTPFRGSQGERNPTGLLADDGDHPNAQGHQLIADALLRAGVAPLAAGG